MKIKNLFAVLLLLMTLSACDVETEELVDVNDLNKPKVEEMPDYVDDGEDGKQLSQEEIEDLEFEAEVEKLMEEADLENDSALVDELIELEGKKQTGEAAKGSCDAIADASTCLEFYGSFWTKTSMELQCSDAGVFSLKPCPEGSIGGCNVGNGGPNDMVTWFYNIGGSPIGDSLPYAQKACDATIMSRWITGR